MLVSLSLYLCVYLPCGQPSVHAQMQLCCVCLVSTLSVAHVINVPCSPPKLGELGETLGTRLETRLYVSPFSSTLPFPEAVALCLHFCTIAWSHGNRSMAPRPFTLLTTFTQYVQSACMTYTIIPNTTSNHAITISNCASSMSLCNWHHLSVPHSENMWCLFSQWGGKFVSKTE